MDLRRLHRRKPSATGSTHRWNRPRPVAPASGRPRPGYWSDSRLLPPRRCRSSMRCRNIRSAWRSGDRQERWYSTRDRICSARWWGKRRRFRWKAECRDMSPESVWRGGPAGGIGITLGHDLASGGDSTDTEQALQDGAATGSHGEGFDQGIEPTIVHPRSFRLSAHHGVDVPNSPKIGKENKRDRGERSARSQHSVIITKVETCAHAKEPFSRKRFGSLAAQPRHGGVVGEPYENAPSRPSQGFFSLFRNPSIPWVFNTFSLESQPRRASSMP